MAQDGTYWVNKVSSTPDNYVSGIIKGIRQIPSDRQISGKAIQEVIDGTSVFSRTRVSRWF